jgi:hypothetical protein
MVTREAECPSNRGAAVTCTPCCFSKCALEKAETRPPLAREPGFGLELTPKSQAFGKFVRIMHVPSSGS